MRYVEILVVVGAFLVAQQVVTSAWHFLRGGGAAWRAARDLPGLAELTIRYLEGGLREAPGYVGPPNDETAEIVQALKSINRAGLVTVASQPGMAPTSDAAGCAIDGQRAWLSAIGARTLVEEVAQRCAGAGLMVDVGDEERGHVPWRDRLVVTIDRGRPLTFAAADGPTVTMGARRGWLRRRAREVLSTSRTLCVVDPEWGREHLLWETVLASLDTVA